MILEGILAHTSTPPELGVLCFRAPRQIALN